MDNKRNSNTKNLKNMNQNSCKPYTDENQKEYWDNRLRLFKKILGTPQKIGKKTTYNHLDF
ncbi:hypothetical protein GCM10009122_33990 [Fulvivirga kasyanovii]